MRCRSLAEAVTGALVGVRVYGWAREWESISDLKRQEFSKAFARGVAILTLLLPGCGDSLLTGEALREPLFTFTGRIEPPAKAVGLSLGVLWVDPTGQAPGNRPATRAQLHAEIDPDGSYSAALFSLPPSDLLHPLTNEAQDDVLTFVWGEVVLYEDGDRNGTFAVEPLAQRSRMLPPDFYRGMSPTHALMYLADPVAHREMVSGLPVNTQGYLIGAANCDHLPWLAPVTANNIDLQVTPHSAEFPDLRQCLRSQPAR
jgi:hypothetical protein